jgi:hypothetical protein
MDERGRRVGENEAVFRSVNDQIDSLNRGMAETSDGMVHIVCECGDLTCVDRISVPASKYEEIRADSVLFFVTPGHVSPDVETVVEQQPDFHVVRKQEGEAELVAEATDPRSDD